MAKNVAVLHIMVGLPCSGKTTYAKRLAEKENALLLTPDVWHIQLFTNDMMDVNHDSNHSKVEKIMLDLAQRVLSLGVSVVLDFGFWAKEERDDLRSLAKRLGVGFKMHYMDTSCDELFARLEIRNQELTNQSFVIPKETLREYIKMFQPPCEDEL